MHKHVLFIDDDDIQNFILNSYLEKVPEVNAQVMDDPKEALHYLIACAENNPSDLPDAIFLDLNMPEISGFEFIEAMERKLAENLWPTVIVLTSSLNTSDREKAISYASVSELLVKPLSFEVLCLKIGGTTAI